MSPRGLSCCGDMLNQHSEDLVFKLDQNQPDGIESGKNIFLREITEQPDNISVASNLSCSPSASSSKSVLAPMASKSNITMVGELKNVLLNGQITKFISSKSYFFLSSVCLIVHFIRFTK